MSNADLHFVIRQDADGVHFKAVTGPLGWGDAQDRAALINKLDRTRSFVRSVHDPRWSHLLAFHKGIHAFRTAAKHAGTSRGLHGSAGGAIRDASGAYWCQGWDSYGYRSNTVVRGELNGQRGAWALLRGTDPNAEAVAS